MSVNEAAATLNLSRQRIHQLLHTNALEGEKSGNTWLVKTASVIARKEEGRPEAA